MYLSALSLALNRPGAVSLEQVVASLFANNEQGAWYDPSAANVTWRRNLLTRTEEFNDSAWLKTNLTATANATTAPDSTSTADKLVAALGAGGALQHFTYVNFSSLVAGTDYVFSVYLKAAEYTWAVVYVGGTAKGRYINLSSGNIPNRVGSAFVGAPTSTQVTDAGNGWWKVSMLVNMGTAASGDTRIYLATADGNNVSIGDDTSGLFAWGAQFERSSSATAYQRIVTPEITYLADVQSQPLLFQDSTGATPVTAVEQPVGLILDKRKGLVLGPELVTNGTFTTDTNWNKAAGWTISGGTANASAATGSLDQPMATTQGKYYVVTYTVSNYVSGQVRFQTDSLASAFVSANGTYKIYFLQTAAAQVNCIFYASGFTGSIDNISVKLLDGNHAYQTGSTARPVLRARYNLLTYSEQFNTTWNLSGFLAFGSGSVANAIAAPDATTTADLVVPTTVSATHSAFQSHTTATSGATYCFSVYAKAGGYNFITITDNSGGTISARFNLALGTKITGNGDITAAGNGWYRLQAYGTAASATITPRIYITETDAVLTYTGDGTSGIYLWGADLRVGTSAGDYQRIAAATDYATTSTITGQPFRPYLNFDAADGTGDWLQAGVTQSAYPLTLAAGIENLAASSVGGIMSLAASDSVYKTLRHTGVNGNDVNDREAANTTTSTVTVAGRKFALGQFETSAMTVEVNTTNTQTAANTNAFGSLTTLFLGKVRPSGLISDSKIYGALAINRVLTAGEKSATQSYMASKMGVTL